MSRGSKKRPGECRYASIHGTELLEKLFEAKHLRTTEELIKAFVAAGLSEKPMSPRLATLNLLAALISSGKVRRVAEGEYRWVKA